MPTPLALLGSGAVAAPATEIAATNGGADMAPTPSALILVHVGGRNGSGTLGVTSVSSTFATGGWTRVAEMVYSEDSNVPMGSLWMAVASSTPGAGTVTAQLSPSSSRAAIAVYETTGQHLAAPLRQVKTAALFDDAGLQVTLDEAPLSDSLVAGFIVGQVISALEPGASGAFTEAGEVTSGGGTQITVQAQYDADAPVQTVDWADLNANRMVVMIAAEITAAATGGEAYTLTAEQGTFTATGQSAALRGARRMAADAGTFALTGQSATLSAGRRVAADRGTFAAAGQSADLIRGYRLAAEPGTLVLTGQDASLVYTPAAGAYTLTAETGTYTATGQDAALTAARRIAATTGTYALTGQAATLAHGLTLTAEPGTLALAGQAATLTRTRIMAAETGAFTLSGQAAALTWSGQTAPTVPAERTYVVPFESRTFAVPFENRTLTA